MLSGQHSSHLFLVLALVSEPLSFDGTFGIPSKACLLFCWPEALNLLRGYILMRHLFVSYLLACKRGFEHCIGTSSSRQYDATQYDCNLFGISNCWGVEEYHVVDYMRGRLSNAPCRECLRYPERKPRVSLIHEFPLQWLLGCSLMCAEVMCGPSF